MGTSEIMEMTIARDRWQEHIKTRGRYYLDAAEKLESLHAAQPDVGAGTAALAHRTLAAMLEQARVNRLTRNQHVLLRLGELIAWTECAGSLARRAGRAREGRLTEKADKRFDADALAVISRVFAREAAMKVGGDGFRIIAGSIDGGVPADFADTLGLSAIHSAQAGLTNDQNTVADILYGRGS